MRGLLVKEIFNAAVSLKFKVVFTNVFHERAWTCAYLMIFYDDDGRRPHVAEEFLRVSSLVFQEGKICLNH